MRQARKIRDVTKPHHVLMACDAMTGQDAVVQAREFMREVDTTGFILTKLDGDARGGAALSMTAVTGRPVYFVGTGEKVDDLEPFYPDRMAGRILGMGDVLTLIEKAQETVDQEARRGRRGAAPAGPVQPRGLPRPAPRDEEARLAPGPHRRCCRACRVARRDEGPRRGGRRRQLRQAEAIILSMTPGRAARPAIISGSRRLRIANESGVTTADVNALLKDFEGARKMMRTMMGGKRGPGMKMPARLPNDRREVREMATRIRLRRMGAKKRPFYRVVVADQRSPRDGRFIEIIGKYHPLNDPSLIEIDEERALHWLRVGAQPSDQVRNLMSRSGSGSSSSPSGRAPRRRPSPSAPRRKRSRRRRRPRPPRPQEAGRRRAARRRSRSRRRGRGTGGGRAPQRGSRPPRPDPRRPRRAEEPAELT